MSYITNTYRYRRINSIIPKIFINNNSNSNNTQIRSYRSYKSNEFIARHIGPREHEKKTMLETLGFKV
jgi:hypothetical protein